MLRSEGRRCSAAGVLARMEWSFTCTGAGQQSSLVAWRAGVCKLLRQLRQYVSVQVSGPAVQPWRGLRRPSIPEASKKQWSFGERGPRSAAFALALG